MIGSNSSRWGWLVGLGLATACVAEDKNVGVEDTEVGSSGADSGESSETSGGTGVSASSSAGTSSSGGTTTTETGISETATDGTETGGTESTTGEPFDLPCGDALFCTGGDVCIETVFPPECQALPEGEMCPPDQVMSQCGGIGFACCCDPPPPAEYACVAPVDCVGPASCECLGDVCGDGLDCIAQGADPEHLFRCEAPAKP